MNLQAFGAKRLYLSSSPPHFDIPPPISTLCCNILKIPKSKDISKPLFPRHCFSAFLYDTQTLDQARRIGRVTMRDRTVVSPRQEMSKVDDCKEHDGD
jgi:hypothetical protein